MIRNAHQRKHIIKFDALPPRIHPDDVSTTINVPVPTPYAIVGGMTVSKTSNFADSVSEAGIFSFREFFAALFARAATAGGIFPATNVIILTVDNELPCSVIWSGFKQVPGFMGLQRKVHKSYEVKVYS